MILVQIHQRMSSVDRRILSKVLGYQSADRFEKTFRKLEQTASLYDWIYSGHYDFVNTAESFVKKLVSALSLDEKQLQREIDETRKLRNEEERFNGSYIFVETNFKRRNEPVFALAALESERRIPLYHDKEFLFKSTEEILNALSKRIKRHYIQHQNRLSVWGKISCYQVHLFGETYVFDIDGHLLEQHKQ